MSKSRNETRAQKRKNDLTNPEPEETSPKRKSKDETPIRNINEDLDGTEKQKSAPIIVDDATPLEKEVLDKSSQPAEEAAYLQSEKQDTNNKTQLEATNRILNLSPNHLSNAKSSKGPMNDLFHEDNIDEDIDEILDSLTGKNRSKNTDNYNDMPRESRDSYITNTDPLMTPRNENMNRIRKDTPTETKDQSKSQLFLFLS
jgi:hypothetical protein